MALLNIANTYADILGNIGLTPATTGDYVKLFFSKDGHIITHGRDFLATFTPSERGLVPAGSENKVKKILRGNATWAEIATSDLPIALVSDNKATTIPTTLGVKQYVDSSFAANDAMRYKGSIKYADGSYTTTTAAGADVPGFPTTCTIGDTYRIASDNGTFAGLRCMTGDMLICIKDGSGDSLNSATYWTVIETNINGTTAHSVNGTAYTVYTNDISTKFTIFAPTTGGTDGQVLTSNGSSAPTWVNQSTLSVGLAAKVTNALSAGAGLSLGSAGDTYNGSAAKTVKLVPATATTIGGVIVDKANTKKTISVNSEGSIYLTHDNVCNALGFVPGNSADAKSYSVILADTATATAAKASTNPFINLVLTVGDTLTVTGTVRVSGSGNVTAVGSTTGITIGLNAATADNYGGIKLGYATSGKNYAVKLDSDGKAYVNVPWPGLATASTDGLVPRFDTVGTGTIDGNSWILAKLKDGAYDWFKLPANAFLNTWRDILVGGTSIGSKKLNFNPSDNVCLIVDSGTDDTYDLRFGLCWYNINTDSTETA